MKFTVMVLFAMCACGLSEQGGLVGSIGKLVLLPAEVAVETAGRINDTVDEAKKKEEGSTVAPTRAARQAFEASTASTAALTAASTISKLQATEEVATVAKRQAEDEEAVTAASTFGPTEEGSTFALTQEGSTIAPAEESSTIASVLGKRQAAEESSTIALTEQGSTFAPTEEGSTIAPAEEGSYIAPAEEGSYIAPAEEGSTIAPTEEGSTIAPTEEGSTIASVLRKRQAAEESSTVAFTEEGSTFAPTEEGSTIASVLGKRQAAEEGSTIAPDPALAIAKLQASEFSTAAPIRAVRQAIEEIGEAAPIEAPVEDVDEEDESTEALSTSPAGCCPDGWLMSNAKCYYFERHTATKYEEAVKQCADLDAQIWTPNTLEEFEAVRVNAQSTPYMSWVGGVGSLDEDDELVYSWEDGSDVDDIDNFPWTIQFGNHGYTSVSQCTAYMHSQLNQIYIAGRVNLPAKGLVWTQCDHGFNRFAICEKAL